ncbi:hypothetical protein PVAP13_2KG088300 [Panicum virgatum]|uniref:Uncharacterized protein n=1 Tax=Panicum virgatum TaxID=38727 RepID=A0A8T0W327_PANVG|nr:hypothetical protein PVAP13_2KG088300 [Panicum virgatum]
MSSRRLMFGDGDPIVVEDDAIPSSAEHTSPVGESATAPHHATGCSNYSSPPVPSSSTPTDSGHMVAATSTAARTTPSADARYTAMATPPRRVDGDPSSISLHSPLATLTPSEIGTPDPDRTYTHVSTPKQPRKCHISLS